jgi:hypothetical protein
MVIRNKRLFLRPIEDHSAGAMTSMHSLITKDGNELRGELHFRDCEHQISFEFWTGDGARPGGRARAANMLSLIRDEIDEFLRDYDEAARPYD